MKEIKVYETKYICDVCGCSYCRKEDALNCEKRTPTKYGVDGYGTYTDNDWKLGDIVLVVDRGDDGDYYNPRLGVIKREDTKSHYITPIIVTLDGCIIDNRDSSCTLLATNEIAELVKWLNILVPKVVSDKI